MENLITGYIINNAKTNCHHLVYKDGKHNWVHKGDGDLITVRNNPEHPSVFDTQEDAYGYAYNVANLDKDEFTIQEMAYNPKYY